MESKTYTAFERLSDILDTLRRECPWDRVQTMKSLRYLTIEEVHELSEAIVAADGDEIKKELGDLAMHILFYCKLAEEAGLFTTADVYNAVCDKLVSRHPFIYRKDDYHGESWEQLKQREGDHKGSSTGCPTRCPRSSRPSACRRRWPAAPPAAPTATSAFGRPRRCPTT